MSGVEATIMMSTPSLLMRSPATVAARLVSDCESLVMISIGCVWPSPHLTPPLTAAFHCWTRNWSVSPNAASGPVSGVTKPTLMGRPVAAALPLAPLELLLLPQAARTLLAPPAAPATPNAAPATPATLRKSRRVTGFLPNPVSSGCEASLDVRSSELMPPPCLVPPDVRLAHDPHPCKNPPLGPFRLPGRRAPSGAPERPADDAVTPAWMEPVSMASPHLPWHPPCGRSFPRYGHHIAAR